MNTLEVLSKVQELTQHWEERKMRFKGGSPETNRAAADFRALQTSIEKSLEQDAEGMWKEHLNEQKEK